MAQAAQNNVATFKLVLVGDGGTGKVRSPYQMILVTNAAKIQSRSC